MAGRLMTFLILFSLGFVVRGSVHNSPCRRTTDWSNYHLQCFTSHKIYLKRHIIEDGFKRLQFADLGCSVKDALYCGTDLPVNNSINPKSGGFTNAVKQCNGKSECTLSKDYFVKTEASVRDSCKASLNSPDVQNAMFRQSLEYECIQDAEIMDMCTTSSENRSHRIYLHASMSSTRENCTCHVTGYSSRVEILQTSLVQMEILSFGKKMLYDIQDSNVSIYGKALIADSPTLTVVFVSKESIALIKIAGNVLIECNKERTEQTTRIRKAFLENASEPTNSHLSSLEIFTKSASKILISTTEEPQPDQNTSVDVSNLMQNIIIVILCFLLIAVLTTNCKQRALENKSAEINIKDVEQRLLLVCQPSQDNRRTKIEIHRADCMCDTSDDGKKRSSNYTPLQIGRSVRYSKKENDDYLVVIE